MAEVRGELARRLRERSDRLEHRVRTQGVVAWMAAGERRVWSPSMDAQLREHPSGTLIIGRFGPNASLMTSYYFASILLLFLVGLSATWGFVQSTMGQTPKCLMGSSLGLFALVFVWVSSRVGVWLAHDQMVGLAELLDDLGVVVDDEAAVLNEAHAAAAGKAG
jgi:hypothetical protein